MSTSFSTSDTIRFRNFAADQLAELKLQGVDDLQERSLLFSHQLIETAVALLVERELVEDVPSERVQDIRDFAMQRIYESLLVDIEDEIQRDIRFPPTTQQMTEMKNGMRNRFPQNVPEENE